MWPRAFKSTFFQRWGWVVKCLWILGASVDRPMPLSLYNGYEWLAYVSWPLNSNQLMSVQFSFRLHKYCQHTRKLWDESCTFFCARIRAYFYIISAPMWEHTSPVNMPIVIVTLSIDLQQSRQIHSVVSSHLSLSHLEVVRAISYKVMLNKILF